MIFNESLYIQRGYYLMLFMAKLYSSETIRQKKIYIYEVHTISFQTFFVWAFEIVVDSWKFSMVLLYILWDEMTDQCLGFRFK